MEHCHRRTLPNFETQTQRDTSEICGGDKADLWKWGIMKKNILFLIGFLTVFLLNSCLHTPDKIEKYVKKHCDFDKTDICYIDMRKALKVDYDTMYVFKPFTPLTVVQNILGIGDYGKSKEPETTLIMYDSHKARIVLTKNHKIVYEDEYYYKEYNTELFYWIFTIVKGQGIFDGSPIEDDCYMYTNPIFEVERLKNEQTYSYSYTLFPYE